LNIRPSGAVRGEGTEVFRGGGHVFSKNGVPSGGGFAVLDLRERGILSGSQKRSSGSVGGWFRMKREGDVKSFRGERTREADISVCSGCDICRKGKNQDASVCTVGKWGSKSRTSNHSGVRTNQGYMKRKRLKSFKSFQGILIPGGGSYNESNLACREKLK